MKTFRVLSAHFEDEEVVREDFLDRVADIFGHMSEFIGMLNDVCMPDDDNSSDSDEDASEGEEDEEGNEEEEV